MHERSASPFRPLDLVALRQKRGVSLEQIAEATKISVGYLRAIEEGRFERLPGGIYDLNYLRQYARAIGLEEEVLLGHYRTAMAEREPSRAEGSRGKFRPWLRGPASVLRNLI